MFIRSSWMRRGSVSVGRVEVVAGVDISGWMGAVDIEERDKETVPGGEWRVMKKGRKWDVASWHVARSLDCGVIGGGGVAVGT